MLNKVDVIFGAAWGDEGKGKICSRIAKDYDMVCRFNGGDNAGHTFYVDGQKVVTHLIPSGICYDKISVIGPNCVVNVDNFFKEVQYLKELGFDISLIKISPNAHVVTQKHIDDDKQKYHQALGTTAKGIGPCYADKVLRVGSRAENYLDSSWLWDGKLEGDVLCEGAQSFWLDINQGYYPYVTSSECLPYSSCSLGFSPKKIDRIIGVAKMYDTRSGIDPYFDLDDDETQLVTELGSEYGTTTGRRRHVKWLNLNKLSHALKVSGATDLVLNKGDVLEEANVFKLIIDENICGYQNIQEMQSTIVEYLEPLNLSIEFDFRA